MRGRGKEGGRRAMEDVWDTDCTENETISYGRRDDNILRLNTVLEHTVYCSNGFFLSFSLPSSRNNSKKTLRRKESKRKIENIHE